MRRCLAPRPGVMLVRDRRAGFTLIELLTVIAILTLLIGILIPSLSASRQGAKANACLSKLKGIGTAFAVYLTENKDTFPPHRLKNPAPGSEVDYVNEYNRKHPRWQWFLETGFGPVIDPKPFARLEAPFGDEGLGAVLNGTTMTHDVFVCPSLDDERFSHDERNGAYGFNYQYLGNARTQSNPKVWDNFPVPSHRIKSPAQTVLVADSRGAGPRHGAHSYTLDPPRLATEQHAVQFGPDAAHVEGGHDPAVNAYSPVELRHRKRANVIVVDTHGESQTWWDLGYDAPSDSSDPNYGKIFPVWDAETSISGKWSNRKWNGTGSDPLAPVPVPGDPPTP
jgi:prepilin-type N-terminal cleavage/methylation domain-containing protein